MGVGDWRPPGDPDDDDWERWGWPWVLGGLVIVDVWLVNLGVWWFGLWPP